MDIEDLKKRSEAYSEGEWVSDLPGLPSDVSLRVRSMESPIAVSTYGRLVRDLPEDQRREGGLPLPEVEAEIDRRVLVDAILLDWAGLERDGEPVPFSVEQATKWIEIELFEAAVRAAAARVTANWATRREQLEGNSQPPSGGGSGRGKRRKSADAT